MPRRLLCCSGSLQGGGSERQLWQLAMHLDADRYAPSFYLHYRRGTYLKQLPQGIPVHAFWDDRSESRFWLPGSIHRAQVAHLASVIDKSAIDIVLDRTFHMTLVTAPACKRANIPRVSTIVSPPSQDFGRSQERFKGVKRRMLREAYRDSRSRLIAVSQAVADDATLFYDLEQSEIMVVPSPVDIEGIEQAANVPVDASEPNAADAAGNRTDAPFKLVVVGRLSAEKGQRVLVQALARVCRKSRDTNVHLDIIGDGPDRSALERLVEDLGIAGQVRFHGFRRNPYPWIRNADLLCLPSQYEGLPNVVMEAMALETPVLATRCSESIVELLGQHGERGQLVPVDSAEHLTQALLGLIPRPTASHEATKMTKDAKEWIHAHHRLDQWLRRMQTIFDSL